MRRFSIVMLCFGLAWPMLSGGAAPAADSGQAPAARQLSMTLQEAVSLALKQNPDYLLARLDEEKARQAVREARAPYVPRISVGSGAAYSSGFPLSIEGSAPSIVQAYASQSIYNRSQGFRIREANEMAKASGHSTGNKSEEIAWTVASAYLDLERAVRATTSMTQQVEAGERIERLVEELVGSGREIPLELARSRVETARSRSRLDEMRGRVDILEQALRGDLGLGSDVRITPVETQLPSQVVLPATEEEAVSTALANSEEIKRLDSVRLAKQYVVQAEKGARYPKIDLVAQVALFGQYNHYQDYFRAFQRVNGELGMSFQLPVFASGQISPRVAQAEAEVAQAGLRMEAARSAIALDTRRLYQQVRQTEASRDVARLELDLARQTLSVNLSQLDEGRISLRKVEEARVVESQSWEAYFDAQTAAQKARLGLLRETGSLLAALR